MKISLCIFFQLETEITPLKYIGMPVSRLDKPDRFPFHQMQFTCFRCGEKQLVYEYENTIGENECDLCMQTSVHHPYSGIDLWEWNDSVLTRHYLGYAIRLAQIFEDFNIGPNGQAIQLLLHVS